MKLYTVFNLTNGHLQLPSGAYLSPRGDRDGRDRAYPVDIPVTSLLWRMADARQGKPEVKIVEGDATGEDTLPVVDPRPKSEPGQEIPSPVQKEEAASESSPPAEEEAVPEQDSSPSDETTPEEDLQEAVESEEASVAPEAPSEDEAPAPAEVVEAPADTPPAEEEPVPAPITELPAPESSEEEGVDELAGVMEGLGQDAEDDSKSEDRSRRSRGGNRRSRRKNK